MEVYRQLGVKLRAAKEACGHGKFLPWLESLKYSGAAAFGLHPTRAQTFMRLSENFGDILDAIAPPELSMHSPKASVNTLLKAL
ncbi:hypothetical protein DYH55_16325 [Methylovirgula sp. 4M-Z18]|nr:hypothetical protein DYH55_16325 [Methylovirgula sp. 4M-Z18]